MYDYNVFKRKKNEDDITFIIFHNIIVGLVKIKRDEFTVGKVIIKLFTLLIEKFPSTLPILPELTTLLYLYIIYNFYQTDIISGFSLILALHS